MFTDEKIIDYVMVCHPDPAELIKRVNEAIEKGWQPLGGISVGLADHRTSFAQALVKTADRRATE